MIENTGSGQISGQARGAPRRRALIGSLAAALIAIPGCGGGDGGERAAAQLGPQGGELRSHDGRVTVTVPPGALAESVELTIDPVEAARPGAIGAVYDIGPSGTRFAVPVTIAISYAGADLASSPRDSLRVVTFVADDAGARAARLTHPEHRAGQSIVAGRTEHLSEFGLQSIDVPISLAGVQWYHSNISQTDGISLIGDCPADRRARGGCGWNLEVIFYADNEAEQNLAIDGATEARNAGLTNIVRIDWTQGNAVPRDFRDYQAWADNFLARVTAFVNAGLATRFIVGNEPPLDGGITADQYVAAFNYLYCRKQQSGLDIELLAAGPNAWIPSDWFDSVLARLDQVDGFAIHTYHDPERCPSNPGVEDPDYPGTDLCCGEMCPDVDPQAGEKRCCNAERTWPFDGGFRYLHYQLRSIQRYWGASRPVYITEFNSNWYPVDNYRDGVVSGGFRSLRGYLADACASSDMPRVLSLMWFVDSPNHYRDLQVTGTWDGFSLARVDRPTLRSARTELAREFQNPLNGGEVSGASCRATGGGGSSPPAECTSSDGLCSPGCTSDTLTITYAWSAAGGVDLDTRTAIIAPERGIDVGWHRAASDETYLTWSGDEQGASGSETVTVNLAALAAAYPDAQTFSEFRVRLRGFWYNAVSDRVASITVSACGGNGASISALVDTAALPQESDGVDLGVLVYRRADGAFTVENPTGAFTCTP